MMRLFAVCALLGFAGALAAPPSTQLKTEVISEEKVTNVKEINIYLNIPANCRTVYNNIIKQLEDCRDGVDRGHPKLTNGCLFKLNLSQYKEECESGEIVLFPEEKQIIEFPDQF